MTAVAGSNGNRRSATDYLDEGLRLLGDLGSEGLTVAVLCERLDVTKGSFYHHFESLPDFTARLLAHWEHEHTERLESTSSTQPDPALRWLMFIDMTLDLPHACEAAIRGWARSSPEVATVVARVDRRRLKQVVETGVALGLDRDRATLFTRLALDALVGQQIRERRVNRGRLRTTMEELTRLVFTGSGSPVPL